jgi:hypothetical protein
VGNQQFTTVTFDGERIKLLDLKKVIVENKKFHLGADLELMICNISTAEGMFFHCLPPICDFWEHGMLYITHTPDSSLNVFGYALLTNESSLILYLSYSCVSCNFRV